MTQDYDAIVIGVGAVGSFALRALARDGGRYLGIERFAMNHTHGSSHGRSRVYRTAYFEHASYVPWCQYSVQQFRQLEDESNLSLLNECGTLLMEPVPAQWDGRMTASTTTLVEACEPVGCVIADAQQAARRHGIPVDYLHADALSARFPQFNHVNSRRVPMHGLWEPTGGLVRPERVLQAIRHQLEAAPGVTLQEHTTVLGFTETKSSTGETIVEVRYCQEGGEPQMATTSCLLVAAGSWTGQLIPSWQPLLKPVRQLQGWLNVVKHGSPQDASVYEAGKMPTFFIVHPDFPIALYGIPRDVDDDETSYAQCIKLGIHQRNVPVVDPSTDHPATPTAAEIQEMEQAFTAAFDARAWDGTPQHKANESGTSPASNANPPLEEVRPCLYTMTADAHFLIGPPRPYQRVFGVAGLSGHGFKMAPALGQMMADFAHGKSLEAWQADFCSPDRFLGNT